MKSPSYAEMELIQVPEPHSCKPSPFAWFNRGLAFLNQFLWQPGELQIKTKTNRQGVVCWIVYDPLGDRVLDSLLKRKC